MSPYRQLPDMPDDVADRYPGSTFLLWPHGRRGPWLVRVQWTRVNERLECVGVEMKSFRESGEAWPAELPTWDEGPEILTASALRGLPLGAILRDLREEGWRSTMQFADSIEAPGDTEAHEIAEGLRRGARRNRQARPRGIPPLEEIANVYTEAVRRRANPTQAVERHWSVAHSTAAKWVMRARRDGLLPPAPQGKGKRS